MVGPLLYAVYREPGILFIGLDTDPPYVNENVAGQRRG